MDFRAAQQEIDSILKTLNDVEQNSGLGRDDPSVIALEEIMLRKIAALEATKLKALQVPDANRREPGDEQAGHTPTILFASDEEEPNR